MDADLNTRLTAIEAQIKQNCTDIERNNSYMTMIWEGAPANKLTGKPRVIGYGDINRRIVNLCRWIKSGVGILAASLIGIAAMHYAGIQTIGSGVEQTQRDEILREIIVRMDQKLERIVTLEQQILEKNQ